MKSFCILGFCKLAFFHWAIKVVFWFYLSQTFCALHLCPSNYKCLCLRKLRSVSYFFFTATAFQTPVIVPNQPSKINPGRALLHFYDNHFALTPEIPKEVINSWSLSALQKYTFVGDSIFFSSTTSKGRYLFLPS